VASRRTGRLPRQRITEVGRNYKPITKNKTMPIDNENEVTTEPEAVEAEENGSAQNESPETELSADEPSNSLPEVEDKAE